MRCWSKSNSTNRICWVIKKKLDADYNGTDAGNVQSMLILRILEKIKETRFSQASVAVL